MKLFDAFAVFSPFTGLVVLFELLNGLVGGSNPFEEFAESDASVEDEVYEFARLSAHLNGVADSRVDAYSEVVADSSFQYLLFRIDLTFIANLDDSSICVSGNSGLPYIVPLLVSFQPLHYALFEAEDISLGKRYGRPSPSQTPGEVIARADRDDAKRDFVYVYFSG
jgi:hypothetical protein